jgi:hypothetical protein
MKKVLMGVSLIDHTLISDLFETSVVIDIFVVSGTDAEKQIFKSPADSTPLLSCLIKIGHMLVMQRSAVALDDGDIASPSEIFHQVHSGLLTGHTPSPLGWAILSRAYGNSRE